MFRFGISQLAKRRCRLIIRNLTTTSTKQMNVLPFKISRTEADNILFKKQQFLEKTSKHENPLKNNELVIYEKDPVHETYVPFHTVDVKGLTSYYAGRSGTDSLEPFTYFAESEDGKQEMYTKFKVVTTWSNISGTLRKINYPLGTKELQIYAGFKYPGKYAQNSLATEHIVNMTALTDEMLINENKQRRSVEPHEMTSCYALKRINGALYDMEKRRAVDFITKAFRADHVDLTVFEMNTDEADIKQYSYHTSAYVNEYEENGRKLYKIVNGYTGNYDGQTVYSFWKSLLFGASVGGLATPLLFIGSPVITASLLAARMMVGAAAVAFPAGALAKMYPFLKYKHETHKLEQEKQKNKQTLETLEDELRRKLADAYNTTTTTGHVEEVINNLPVDKCKLLSIDPKNKVTSQQLKEAYHKQIKKFHPDVYKGDKEVGDNMTKNINEAYKTLEKII